MRPIDADFLESVFRLAADILLQKGNKAAAKVVAVLADDLKHCPTLERFFCCPDCGAIIADHEEGAAADGDT